ncbi:MAG TPA: response regulator transcription factor, partial [Conexibacter sp.]|nr:response regulator transcription factor [Conexibacter sp.]
MIRVLVVDDHPALRAGLRTVLEMEPGFGFVGESNGDESLWPLLARSSADVLVVDYHLPTGDGLQLCREARRRKPGIRTLLYTAYASPALSLPAAIAGLDGMVRKDAGAAELFDAIRLVHRGERVLPPPPQAVLEEARAQLDPQDQALVGLLVGGCSDAEAAETLSIDLVTVDRAVRQLLSRLHVEVTS